MGTNASKIQYADFGNRLTQLRKGAGLTQAVVASRTSLPLRVYSAYEKGYFIPPLEAARSLAKLFDVTTVELLGSNITTEDLVIARANDELLHIFDGDKGMSLSRDFIKRCGSEFEDSHLALDVRVSIISLLEILSAEATLEAMQKFTPYSRRGDDWDKRCAELQEAVDRMDKMIDDRFRLEIGPGKFPAFNAEEDGALPESEGSCDEESVSTA